MFANALVTMRDKEAFLTLVYYGRHSRDNTIYAYSDDGLLVSQWRFRYNYMKEFARERAEESMKHHIRAGDYPLVHFSREEILLEALDS